MIRENAKEHTKLYMVLIGLLVVGNHSLQAMNLKNLQRTAQKAAQKTTAAVQKSAQKAIEKAQQLVGAKKSTQEASQKTATLSKNEQAVSTQPSGKKTATPNITVLTYNLFMLPFQEIARSAKTVGALIGRDLSKIPLTKLDTDAIGRAKQLPAALAALPVDVYAFQEGFHKPGRQAVRHGLADLGLKHTTSVLGRNALLSHRFANSGLWFMSRHPILQKDGIFYQDAFKGSKGISSFGSDSIADKGVYYIAVEKNGKKYHIFSTHMQAATRGPKETPDMKPPYLGTKIRAQQFERIKQFIDSLKIPANEPVIIVGDFNVDKSNPQTRKHLHEEYLQFKKILNAEEADPTDNAPTSFFSERRAEVYGTEGKPAAGERIDYILYSLDHRKPTKSWSKAVAEPFVVNKKPILSDHAPLMGYFEFDGY